MGKVKTELSPPDEENEEDFTNHLPGIMTTIDLGLCDDEYVKFSLTSAEPYWKMQKGLIIYGVTFTYIYGTYIELLESTDFKVSGECQLKAGEDPYVGHFMVGLAKDHNMGKVKAAKSPPHEESEEDFTCHKPGTMKPIALGLCDGNVKFCLTSCDEPYWKKQKGLIIYGVTFTPMKKP
ncbi:hypothetical protein DCAR_0522546 [Daucus carota subsp. sativus]|uniref:Uncharacterized protein n=1 Tax=Daucus carota subsp. sativus TaxID=79200 RepID=A0A164ZVJ6_DAUCS|nr:hypothetical protein DCAR_0522546 [Daucus carota subsp. sativus]